MVVAVVVAGRRTEAAMVRMVTRRAKGLVRFARMTTRS